MLVVSFASHKGKNSEDIKGTSMGYSGLAISACEEYVGLPTEDNLSEPLCFRKVFRQSFTAKAFLDFQGRPQRLLHL